jgi:hypothetical protein
VIDTPPGVAPGLPTVRVHAAGSGAPPTLDGVQRLLTEVVDAAEEITLAGATLLPTVAANAPTELR